MDLKREHLILILAVAAILVFAAIVNIINRSNEGVGITMQGATINTNLPSVSAAMCASMSGAITDAGGGRGCSGGRRYSANVEQMEGSYICCTPE